VVNDGRLHVHRVQNGIPSVHPIRGDEMRALRNLRRESTLKPELLVEPNQHQRKSTQQEKQVRAVVLPVSHFRTGSD
jgi:hypothetical protein